MTYLGYEVLAEEPDRYRGEGAVLRWSADVLDNTTGLLDVERHALTPLRTRPMRWMLFSRPEITAFLAWLEERRGRQRAFWMPTWQSDIRLTAAQSSNTQLRIQAVGYTARYFPHPARRHLALIRPSGLITAHRVTGVTTPAPGEELLTISPAVLTAERMPLRGGLVSFLALCRLDSDTVEVHWRTPAVAEVELQMIELPREAPLS